MTLAILRSLRIASSNVRLSRRALSSSACFWATRTSVTIKSENRFTAPCSHVNPGEFKGGAPERDDDEIDADPRRYAKSQDSEKGGPADDLRDLVHNALLTLVRPRCLECNSATKRTASSNWFGACRGEGASSSIMRFERQCGAAAPPFAIRYLCVWLLPCAVSECSCAVFEWAWAFEDSSRPFACSPLPCWSAASRWLFAAMSW